MKQYPDLDLFEAYQKSQRAAPYHRNFPDRTKRHTLRLMNMAINLCEDWGHAIDIGGGNGHYLAGLARKFKRTTLVEVSAHPEHATLTKDVPNLTVTQTPIESYRTNDKADFILLADVFEHIPDIRSFVNILSNLQNTGGVVYIMTPNPLYCGPAPESGTYHTRHAYGHIKHYTVAEITDLMSAGGYRLELLRYEEAPFRQLVKRLLSGLIRRDTALAHFFPYRYLRHLTTWPLFSLVSALADKLVYRNEQLHQHNPDVTMTHSLVFKKK